MGCFFSNFFSRKKYSYSRELQIVLPVKNNIYSNKLEILDNNIYSNKLEILDNSKNNINKEIKITYI